VALNLLWIPRHGYMGSAWATLVTEAAYFGMTAVALARYGHRIDWLGGALRPLGAAAVFAAALWLLRGLGFLPSAVLASLAFLAAAVSLGVWDRRDWLPLAPQPPA
jgi:O-antigen/teichoic acid export membrane protein